MFHLNHDIIFLGSFLLLPKTTKFTYDITSISYPSLIASAGFLLKRPPGGDLTVWMRERLGLKFWERQSFLFGLPMVFWFLKKNAGNFEETLDISPVSIRQLRKRKFLVEYSILGRNSTSGKVAFQSKFKF